MIERLKRYKIFQEEPLLSCKLLEQQGHANRVYLLQTKRKKYLLRHFQIDIDRKREFNIQTKLYRKKIAPKPILLDLNNGVMISEFIEGTHKIKLNQQELKKMAQLLKKVHKTKTNQKRNSFRKNFSFNHKKVKRAFILLEKEKKEYALGHNDLHPKNIIFTKRTIKLIDWEYARYSDIYFDLVSIIIEYKLNKKDTLTFLRSYLGKRKINQKKIKAFTLIYKELWRLWFKKLEQGEL